MRKDFIVALAIAAPVALLGSCTAPEQGENPVTEPVTTVIVVKPDGPALEFEDVPDFADADTDTDSDSDSDTDSDTDSDADADSDTDTDVDTTDSGLLDTSVFGVDTGFDTSVIDSDTDADTDADADADTDSDTDSDSDVDTGDTFDSSVFNAVDTSDTGAAVDSTGNDSGGIHTGLDTADTSDTWIVMLDTDDIFDSGLADSGVLFMGDTSYGEFDTADSGFDSDVDLVVDTDSGLDTADTDLFDTDDLFVDMDEDGVPAGQDCNDSSDAIWAEYSLIMDAQVFSDGVSNVDSGADGTPDFLHPVLTVWTGYSARSDDDMIASGGGEGLYTSVETFAPICSAPGVPIDSNLEYTRDDGSRWWLAYNWWNPVYDGSIYLITESESILLSKDDGILELYVDFIDTNSDGVIDERETGIRIWLP